MGPRRFDQQAYDVVVPDLNLPSGKGFKLCRYIKPHSLRQAVMMLTAFNGWQDKESGFGAGAARSGCRGQAAVSGRRSGSRC